jgi:curli biogenesis system outer membrane secretion channel CsgG
MVMLATLALGCFAQKVAFAEIKPQCPDAPPSKKVRISVSSFEVSTISNPGQLGDELAQMLTDALQNVNCFNVLLSSKDSKQLTDEIKFGQSGNTEDGSAPQTGKMKGAQVIVLGKVTSFSSGGKSAGALGINVSGGNKAKVSFIIQLINAESRELITSKSIETEGKTGGFSGVKILGLNAAGSSNNNAVQDAVHKGIIAAVEYIAAHKDMMPLPDVTGPATAKSYSPANCAVLNSPRPPKVMVIIPEYHIGQRIPDPAAETEINRKFLEAGFQVVDPAMFATINSSVEFKDAAADPAKAISIGKQFGADIVIYGEGFSQRPGTVNANDAGTQNGQASVRARVEVRAVRTDNATLVATNGLEAGALDNAEMVAAKAALRRAAGLIADYLLDQFCTHDLRFAGGSGSGAAGKAGPANGKTVTEITVTGTDYSHLKALADLLAPKGTVLSRTLTNGTGLIKLEHSGGSESIADFIDSKGAGTYSVQNAEAGKITIAVKP